MPEVKDQARRKACKKNLRLFLETYWPDAKPFSDDHLDVIAVLQECGLKGGHFVEAVYRGFGKTTIVERTAIWAAVYGHRSFIILFGANDTLCKGILESIKMELQENDLLAADFPEVVFPIRKTEGIPQRCWSQTYKGEKTNIQWSSDHVVLPTIKGSAASGVIIKPRGLTAGNRGMRLQTSRGVLRPDFVIIDDPQTDESAASVTQVETRLRMIKRTILRLGGHDTKLAVVMCATVIEPDDVVDQLLDHQANPSWRSARKKMLASFSDNHEDLWLGGYAELRRSYDPEDPNDQARAWQAANDFYADNREAMDAGCDVSWEHCYDPDNELSAIQHAYNILIDDGEDVFLSECQNEPPRERGDLEMLTAYELQRKINGYGRADIPQEAETLTAFIDVQGKLLYWLVAAWAPGFTGYIVDYGAFPDQRRNYFTLSDARSSLKFKFPGRDDEGAIYAGLDALTKVLLAKEWYQDDGTPMRIERCLIDAQWGKTTAMINGFCRQSPHGAILMPSHGQSVRATHKPMNEWPTLAGKRKKGLEWVIQRTGKSEIRNVVYDTNYWKKRFHEAFILPHGTTGSLSLFNAQPSMHRMFADHATSELPKQVEHSGRIVYEWELQGGQDNHLYDCGVGAMVAASMCGISRRVDHKKKKKTKVSLAALQAKRRAA